MDEKDFGFKWTVESFQESLMIIQIEFAKPERISAGVSRDMLKVEVKDPKYFFSKESLKTIPLNSTAEIKLPKMMANTQATEVFIDSSATFAVVTQTVLLGNFVGNIMISGALNLLWGLLHCL